MSTPYKPYARITPLTVEERATQIRHLSIIGLATTATEMNIDEPIRCFISLFEVISRLAHEIEEEEQS